MSTLIIPHPEAVVTPVTVWGCQEPPLEEGQCQGCTSVTTHHNHPITITWVLINHLSPAIKTPFKSTLLPVTLWPVYHSLPRNHTRPSVHLPVYDYLSELLRSSQYTPSKVPGSRSPSTLQNIPLISWQLRHIEVFQDSHLPSSPHDLYYLSINHPVSLTCYSRLYLWQKQSKQLSLIKCYSRLWGDITVRANIIGTVSSFSLHFSEHLLNCLICKLICRRPSSYWCVWIFIKNKVIPLFPNVRIRKKAM